MSEFGELIDDSTVRFVRLLPGPIERVWSYLIESDKRAKWFCAGNTELTVGGHVDMHFHNASLSSAEDIERPEKYNDMPEEFSFGGKVTRCEPPHVLAHTWEFDDDSSEVCYELEQVDDKVRLVLTHRRLHSSEAKLSVCGGWHTHLEVLISVLEGREPPPYWKTQTEIEPEYEKRLGL
jgi:uncharacterized protein YndB with AHSA1/START domain